MSAVQQMDDGRIIVRSDTDGTYIDTMANFAKDFNTTAPTLPTGADDRIYEPGIRHAITDCYTIIQEGPMPWTAGDSYIANVATAIQNQKNRQPPPTPITPA